MNKIYFMDSKKWDKRSRDFDSKMAELLRTRRKEKRFSQDFVAEKLGVAQSTLSRIEKGRLSLSLIQWVQIEAILGLSIEDLITGRNGSSS